MKNLFLGVVFGISVPALWGAEVVTPREGRHGGAAGATVTGEFMVHNILLEAVDVVITPTDLNNAGDFVPLKKESVLRVMGLSTFLLKPGESRSVKYTVIAPSPFDQAAAGAFSLVIRKPGDAISTPIVTRIWPVYIHPKNPNAVLSLEIFNPNLSLLATTTEMRGPQKIQVSFIVQNTGSDSVGPRGRVEFRKGAEQMEVLPLQGTQAISPSATAIFSGVTQRTEWPDGEYAGTVILEYGDYYGQPQKLEKTYFFRINGNMISVKPGSSKPKKVSPR
ncbi:MAG: hypothetical protein IPN19_01130 [Elusimicrobia bacterium]|nr:hypothetical protein [Elusimicrobiota bacterium]